MIKRHFLRSAALSLALAGLATLPAKAADPYPNHPIKLVVPLPPGGGGDSVARIMAAELTTRLNQTVYVENKPGGGSIIGTQLVSKAPADGYTLLFATDFHAINGAFGKLPFDSVKDFAPVAQLVELQIILLANPKLGVKNLGELVAAAKKEPGKVIFGSPGTSSPHYLASKLLQQLAGVELLDVPYQGTGPVTTAFLGAQIDLMFAGVGAGMSLAQTGKAVPIAVTGPRRDALARDVPTVAESGYGNYSLASWMAVLAPAGTPEPIVQKLNTEIRAVLADKAVAKKLADAGFTVATGTPEQLGTLVSTDIDKLKQIIAKAGAVPEGR